MNEIKNKIKIWLIIFKSIIIILIKYFIDYISNINIEVYFNTSNFIESYKNFKNINIIKRIDGKYYLIIHTMNYIKIYIEIEECYNNKNLGELIYSSKNIYFSNNMNTDYRTIYYFCKIDSKIAIQLIKNDMIQVYKQENKYEKV